VEATTGEYRVEKLNALLLKIVEKYTQKKTHEDTSYSFSYLHNQ